MRLAVAGVGRIGVLHAQHVQEAAGHGVDCTLAALVDTNRERAETVARRLGQSQGHPIAVFETIEAMLASGAAEGSIVSTPTAAHQAHAKALAEGKHRILLEKPLTGNLAEDRAFSAWLDAHHPHAVMLAFQRRFDAPLQYARQLLESGVIGRLFKIVSILEDSNPAPNGYVSGGILPDMAVHNVDEILWLTGKLPVSAVATGSTVYSRGLSTAVEDFDDAFLQMWFPDRLAAQVTVSRNHVSGYRVETWLFGERGQIHVGRFEQRHREVVVEAYGHRDRQEPIARQVFTMRDYGPGLPEFVDRFGPAYAAELADFVGKCRSGQPFSVTHRDGVNAMEVIDAGMRGLVERGSPAGGV